MKSYIPTRIATYVFASVFAIFGIMHFISGPAMAGLVPLPGGVFWVYLSGACMIAYAVSVYTNSKYEKLAGYLLALMLVLIILIVHMPGIINGTNSMGLIQALKDLALAAAAIVMANHSDMTK